MRTHDAEWQIKRAQVAAPALENGGVTVYSANGNSILLNGFAADKMEFNGNGLTLEGGKTLRVESEQGTVAGNYPFTVTAGGNYWFTLTLTDDKNYEWGDWTAETDPGSSETVKVEGAAARLWYRITQTQFDMGLSLKGWIYGQAHGEPAYTHPETDLPNDKITFTVTGTTNGGESYEASGTPDSVAWPTQAGTYNLKVNIQPHGNYDYGTETVEFTIARTDLVLTPNGASTVYGDGNIVWQGYSYDDLIEGDAIETVLGMRRAETPP